MSFSLLIRQLPLFSQSFFLLSFAGLVTAVRIRERDWSRGTELLATCPTFVKVKFDMKRNDSWLKPPKGSQIVYLSFRGGLGRAFQNSTFWWPHHVTQRKPTQHFSVSNPSSSTSTHQYQSARTYITSKVLCNIRLPSSLHRYDHHETAQDHTPGPSLVTSSEDGARGVLWLSDSSLCYPFPYLG